MNSKSAVARYKPLSKVLAITKFGDDSAMYSVALAYNNLQHHIIYYGAACCRTLKAVVL